VFIRFIEQEKENKKMVMSIEQNTKHSMNAAINLCEYGIGGKCGHMLKHTYAGIREMKMQLERSLGI